MELKHIAGHTFAIEYPSAVGVYLFDDESCVLIDSGATRAFALRTLKILGRKVRLIRAIINTHFHADHSAGNAIIQEHSGCDIYASSYDTPYLNNPFLATYAYYNALPDYRSKFFNAGPCRVTAAVEPGLLLLQEQQFQIVDLTGHSLGQIGIITPDEVLFAGDSLIAPRILETHSFLHMEDIEMQLKTLERLRGYSSAPVYLSHGGLADDSAAAIEANHQILLENLRIIRSVLAIPRSQEDAMQCMVRDFGVKISNKDYVLMRASVSAYITYLLNQGKAKSFLRNGKMLYQTVSGD